MEAVDAWSMLGPLLRERLDSADDPELWACAINAVMRDATALCRAAASWTPITAEIGRCSHWLRPHQSRWTADGGFAWPTGYGGGKFSRAGLPEWDWSLRWRWSPDEGFWLAVEPGRRPEPGKSQFRVAIPARTRWYPQAAVHTIWRPGTPVRPSEHLVQFYGFRRGGAEWATTAYLAMPSDGVYESTGAGLDPI